MNRLRRVDWPLAAVMAVVLVITVIVVRYLDSRRHVGDVRQQNTVTAQQRLDGLYQGTHDAVCVIFAAIPEPTNRTFRIAWDLAKVDARCAAK